MDLPRFNPPEGKPGSACGQIKALLSDCSSAIPYTMFKLFANERSFLFVLDIMGDSVIYLGGDSIRLQTLETKTNTCQVWPLMITKNLKF